MRGTDSGLDGILAIDKPAGWTSHDVVAKARRILGQRRIGHTGTLDPMATGLLVLCLGQATRLVEYMTAHEKRYIGEVTLGRRTTTDDAEGETLEERAVPPLSPATVAEAASSFRGQVSQRPPAFSALKVAGQRAYDLARAGRAPGLAARPVTIERLDVAILGPAVLGLDVTCSAGTYVRSLARDIGDALGCGGHLSALRRLSAGGLSVESAVSLEELQRVADEGRLDDFLLPADEGIASMEAAILSGEAAKVLANGGRWMTPASSVMAATTARTYDTSGAFVGVASVSSSGEITPLKVLARQKSAN